MAATQRLDARDPEQVLEAAHRLRRGELVAFPTETVYGLGANALSAEAVAGIFAAKKRPAWDPLIVHLAAAEERDQIAQLAPEPAQRVAELAEAFWPGPLTLLLPRAAAIPDAVTAGRDLVGVRVPAHPVAQELLRAAGIPVAAPSANLFGHVSPTTAEHVLADLEGRIHAVLDGGPCSVGVESTVLDPLRSPMLIYRQGAVTAAMLRRATGRAVEVYRPMQLKGQEGDDRESLPSPGVGLRHYAPRARLLLIEGGPASVWARAHDEAENAPTGVLWPEDWSRPTIRTMPPGLVVQPWGRWVDPPSRAATLFAALRALEDLEVATIVCPLPEAGGLEDALRDRLEKAARSE